MLLVLILVPVPAVAQRWLMGWVQVGHTLHIGRNTPLRSQPTPRFPMSDIATLTAQLQELQKAFAESVTTITTAIAQLEKEQIQQKKEEELESFHEYLVTVVSETVGDSTFAKLAVGRLNQIRRNPQLSYHHLVTIYREIDENDVTKRVAMLTLSKIYRYKFSRIKDAKLRSEIKYATKCPHCGVMAQRMVDRLKQDGVMV